MQVRGTVALVQQQPWVLGRTVRDNITLGRPGAPLDVACKCP
jgi:ABC-type multidrug transport system fused ATPase/permease subunit